MKFLRNLPSTVKTIVAAFACLPLAACSGFNLTTASSDLVSAVTQGTVVAADVYGAYSAVQQNLTTSNVLTGKLNATNVLNAAQAIVGTAQALTPSLTTAVNSFVEDANATLNAFKGTSASPAAQIATISTAGAAVVNAVAAVAPTTVPNPAPATSTTQYQTDIVKELV